MKPTSNYFVWLIAYIDSAHLDKVTQQLQRYDEYSQIEAYIPTVKILKKSIKNEQKFEEVPLLFNYGFFKIPRKYAVEFEFLDRLKQDISCIYAWVKDPLKVLRSKPTINGDQTAHINYPDACIPAATTTSEQITQLIRQSTAYSAYSKDDLEGLRPGDIITLRGYPWEGMSAEILEVNPNKEEVKVKMMIMEHMREVKLSFDNVFFTIYHSRYNYDDSINVLASLDEMAENNKLDRFLAKYQNKTGNDGE